MARKVPSLAPTKVAGHLKPAEEQIETELIKAAATKPKAKSPAATNPEPKEGGGARAVAPIGYTKATFDIGDDQLRAIIDTAHEANNVPRSTLVRALLAHWQNDTRVQVAVLKLVNDPESGVHRARGLPSHRSNSQPV